MLIEPKLERMIRANHTPPGGWWVFFPLLYATTGYPRQTILAPCHPTQPSCESSLLQTKLSKLIREHTSSGQAHTGALSSRPARRT